MGWRLALLAFHGQIARPAAWGRGNLARLLRRAHARVVHRKVAGALEELDVRERAISADRETGDGRVGDLLAGHARRKVVVLVEESGDLGEILIADRLVGDSELVAVGRAFVRLVGDGEGAQLL